MSSSTANRARTAARTDRARSMISAALAPPRLVSASVCFPEMAARAPSDRAKPFPIPAFSISQAALSFVPKADGYRGQPSGMRSATASSTTGLVKNDPALHVSGSGVVDHHPLARAKGEDPAADLRDRRAIRHPDAQRTGKLGVADHAAAGLVEAHADRQHDPP